MTTPIKKEVVYAAIDIETGGPNMVTHPFVCFGIAIANEKGDLLLQKEIYS